MKYEITNGADAKGMIGWVLPRRQALRANSRLWFCIVLYLPLAYQAIIEQPWDWDHMQVRYLIIYTLRKFWMAFLPLAMVLCLLPVIIFGTRRQQIIAAILSLWPAYTAIRVWHDLFAGRIFN